MMTPLPRKRKSFLRGLERWERQLQHPLAHAALHAVGGLVCITASHVVFGLYVSSGSLPLAALITSAAAGFGGLLLGLTFWMRVPEYTFNRALKTAALWALCCSAMILLFVAALPFALCLFLPAVVLGTILINVGSVDQLGALVGSSIAGVGLWVLMDSVFGWDMGWAGLILRALVAGGVFGLVLASVLQIPAWAQPAPMPTGKLVIGDDGEIITEEEALWGRENASLLADDAPPRRRTGQTF